MPGEASLAAGEYYAYRHNQFWRIAGAIFGFEPDCALRAAQGRAEESRHRTLGRASKAASGQGSLDSAIREDSIRVNDFAAFLAAHPGHPPGLLQRAKAESAWRRHVAPTLPETRQLDYRLLPSTSPAHAGMGYLSKLRVWRSAIP